MLLALVALFGCNNSSKKTDQGNLIQSDSAKISTESKKDTVAKEYAAGTTDETISKEISNYLVTDYLKKDLVLLTKEDRKFQFQTIDLNNDGKQEVFINFTGSYFCGTGGCTLLLLDSNRKLITKFTVSRPPIMVEPHTGKEWAKLMIKDNNVWKELKYNNGKYPGNPSILPKSISNAPSEHAQTIFSDQLAPAKVFEF